MSTLENADSKRQALEAGMYDVADLAALIQCSERHIRNMVENNLIPGCVCFGRLVRFHRGIVNAWLAEKAKGATNG